MQPQRRFAAHGGRRRCDWVALVHPCKVTSEAEGPEALTKAG